MTTATWPFLMYSGGRTLLLRLIDRRALLQQGSRSHQRRGPPFFARSTSAPFSSSIRAASTWPFWQAMYNGVKRRLSPAPASPRRRGLSCRRTAARAVLRRPVDLRAFAIYHVTALLASNE